MRMISVLTYVVDKRDAEETIYVINVDSLILLIVQTKPRY